MLKKILGCLGILGVSYFLNISVALAAPGDNPGEVPVMDSSKDVVTCQAENKQDINGFCYTYNYYPLAPDDPSQGCHQVINAVKGSCASTGSSGTSGSTTGGTSGGSSGGNSIEDIIGRIQAPGPIDNIARGQSGAAKINTVLSNVVRLLYSIAGVVFLVMLIWGAFQYMTAGSNKDALPNAQKRIVNALIGLLILALVFVIARYLGAILGFSLFTNSAKP